MKRFFQKHGFGAGWILGMSLLLVACGPSKDGVLPEIKSISSTQAVVSWSDGRAYAGSIEFGRAGTLETLEALDPVAAETHEVLLEGLEPGTRYVYGIKGAEARYYFTTAPETEGAFSFYMIAGLGETRINELMQATLPDFMLDLGGAVSADADPYRSVRPFLPVIPAGAGMDSPMLTSSGVQGCRVLEWGGRRFLITSGAQLPSGNFEGVIGLAALDAELMTSERFRFALHRGASREVAEGLAAVLGYAPEKLALRIDVSPDAIVATDMEQQVETPLWQAPFKEARTCSECRRLADRGAYEESVKAFEKFIAENAGHFQIDDAYFAIAGLLDEKLFRFPDALEWYEKLVGDFPQSTLTPLARQRITYLKRYSDHNFEPLQVFERSKKMEFNRVRGDVKAEEELLAKVVETAEQFADSAIAPEMLYWIAARYRDRDTVRSTEFYELLRTRYPEHDYAEKSLFSMAEIAYEIKAYADAIAVYREYVERYPDNADVALQQIERVERNLRRAHLKHGSVLVLFVLGVCALLIPRVGIGPGKLLRGGIAFAVLLVAFLVGGWTIQAQFESMAQMLTLCIGIAASAAVAYVLGSALAEKLVRQPGSARMVVNGAVSLIFYLCALYISIYEASPHFLVLVNL